MSSISNDTKEAVLHAAAVAFAKIGFKKTSIDDIAKAAGVAKGTVYLAAESKEELFYQVIYREVRAWQAHCLRLVDPRATADAILRVMAEEAARYITARPLLLDLLAGRLGEAMPRWTERFDDLRAIGRNNLTEVLRLGVRQGRFRPEIDVERVASLLQDFQLAPWILRGNASVEEIVANGRSAVDLLLHGLMCR